MSGLEIVGIAASIIQIADLGAKLSVKLCEFYRQIKSANQSIQSLSSDVALTCNILRELGENLKQDEETKLCSTGAFDTAQEVLRECDSVFTQIRDTIEAQEQDSSRNRFYRAFRKVGIALIERDLNTLRGNLDRLRSTMLLLLNVIMYAGQVRSNAGSAILQQQRELIDTLMEEKRANDEKFNQLRQTVQTTGTGMYTLPMLEFNKSLSDETPSTPSQLEQYPHEVRQYYLLIKALFTHVDAYTSTIEQWQHQRIRDGVARINLGEVSYLANRHGLIVYDLFKGSYFQPSGPRFRYHEDMPAEVQRSKRRAVREHPRPPLSKPQTALDTGARQHYRERAWEEGLWDVSLKYQCKPHYGSPLPARKDSLDAAGGTEDRRSPSPSSSLVPSATGFTNPENFTAPRRKMKEKLPSRKRKETVDITDDDDLTDDLDGDMQNCSYYAPRQAFCRYAPGPAFYDRASTKKRKTVESAVHETIAEPSHPAVNREATQEPHDTGKSHLPTSIKQGDMDNTVDSLVLMWTTLDKRDLGLAMS
ncbi:hypothetical protein Plec18167_005367 [Paecilomyces lecythidis]|uniref:Fungal N-terminal domain-containing protein n=1 Tax=Paecilomyces lecythidis TaxID=3004212 RepID=A0ABR3XJG7_9EURO